MRAIVDWMPIFAIAVAAAAYGCQPAERHEAEGDDTGGGSATDTDTDADVDTDTGTDTGTDTDTGPPPGESFIWISNTGEGTLSKVDTVTAVEAARYYSGPYLSSNDPSRTSVNLHGDMVVTNRDPWTGPSSVTKFAADEDDCVDRNDNGQIDTSTGPSDVRPWGEDECMIWNTPFGSGASMGARATAWDGSEDPNTGEGGRVWIGTCDYSGLGTGQHVFVLDGDDGSIIEEASIPIGCAYGGAVDGNGGFWIFDSSNTAIVRVDMETMGYESFPVACGYGISVDSQGRIWTGGSGWTYSNCVCRFDPETETSQVAPVTSSSCYFLRGIAVGVERSAGSVWAADTSGVLVEVDEETVQVVGTYPIGAGNTIGVAIDYQGYVWAVDQSASSAYRFDPETDAHITVGIGLAPYTYSDMTGVQLRNVIEPE